MDKELIIWLTLLETWLIDVTFDDINDIHNQVGVYIDKLNTISDKLEQQSENIELRIGEPDEVWRQSVNEDDAMICDKAT